MICVEEFYTGPGKYENQTNFMIRDSDNTKSNKQNKKIDSKGQKSDERTKKYGYYEGIAYVISGIIIFYFTMAYGKINYICVVVGTLVTMILIAIGIGIIGNTKILRMGL